MSKKKIVKNSIDAMLEEVRDVITKYGHLDERDVYDALTLEAEGWNARLMELDAADANDELRQE